jgi:hypothetical protein
MCLNFRELSSEQLWSDAWEKVERDVGTLKGESDGERGRSDDEEGEGGGGRMGLRSDDIETILVSPLLSRRPLVRFSGSLSDEDDER